MAKIVIAPKMESAMTTVQDTERNEYIQKL